MHTLFKNKEIFFKDKKIRHNFFNMYNKCRDNVSEREKFLSEKENIFSERKKNTDFLFLKDSPEFKSYIRPSVSWTPGVRRLVQYGYMVYASICFMF